MAWVCLVLAGIFEMIGVTMINKFHQDRRWKSFLLLIACFSASFLFLTAAMQILPMGTAYAVWTGIGAAGGAITGMVFFGEPKNGLRLFFIGIVLSATVGLKLVS
jgi:paired small multidrug resistance pump